MAEAAAQSSSSEKPKTTDSSPADNSKASPGKAVPSKDVEMAEPASTGPFGVSPKQLQKLIDPKNTDLLHSMGGLDAICKALHVDPQIGLKTDESFGLPEEAALAAEAEAMDATKAPWWKRIMMEDPEVTHASPKQKTHLMRTKIFGRNVLPPMKQASLLQLVWMALHDKILILLSVAAIVSLAIGLYEDFSPSSDGKPKAPEDQLHWIEGFAILIAVIIVVMVSSINDYQKEKQFRKLNAKKEDRQARVVRDGHNAMVSVFDIQVGDILSLEPGDLLPVDGVIISCHNLKIDESSATGESDLIRKQSYSNDATCKDPFILSGSKVSEGVGKFVVTAVGEYSFNGKTLLGLRVEPEDTPLQVKLDVLAENIAKIGASISLLLLIILIIKYLIKEAADNSWPAGDKIAEKIVNIFIQAIIIIVVAVPEGLPLAVTLALAYATRRMLKDNNLVRVLAACETMGGATTVCSDKTGTLTQNRMTVVAGVVAVKLEFKENSGIKKLVERFQGDKPLIQPSNPASANEENTRVSTLDRKEFLNILMDSVAINSTAFEEKDDKGVVQFIGSKTENALIDWARKLGQADFNQVRNNASSRIVQVFPFSSERKSMTTIVKEYVGPEKKLVYRVFTKGASEIVLKFCKDVAVVSRDGCGIDVVPLTESIRHRLLTSISSYADQSLRTICMAYYDFSESEFNELYGEAAETLEEAEVTQRTARLEAYIQQSMTCIAIVGIEDPLREGVADAVAKCQKAGVFVRMVTGDNIQTARAIAKKCGIFMKGGIAMEGRVFRQLPKQEMMDMLPRLQVLARSSPMDKQILVQTLKDMGETVAVTGDGTNDGPALKMADIGFSMGIAGTEVAKEASSIILMDDNFSSIVKAMMWGRSVNDSVKKFLQFQLTVNISAVLIAFFSSVTSDDNQSVLTALQLLWINLMMDSLAALALATDPPTEALLDRLPQSKRSPLITVTMWKMIIGQAIFQVVVTFLVLRLGPGVMRYPSNVDALLRTFVFNMFVFFQLFNELNCRRIDSQLNVFENITKNYFFIAIFIGSAIVQVFLVQFAGIAFKTIPMTWEYWLASIFIASLTLPIGVIIRLLPTWDGCVVFGRPVAVPDNDRVIMNKERLQWHDTIGKVRTQLSVYRALRNTARFSNSGVPASFSHAEKKSKTEIELAASEVAGAGAGAIGGAATSRKYLVSMFSIDTIKLDSASQDLFLQPEMLQ